jgi:hypothetical protein
MQVKETGAVNPPFIGLIGGGGVSYITECVLNPNVRKIASI